jgi:hypothetical protein
MGGPQRVIPVRLPRPPNQRRSAEPVHEEAVLYRPTDAGLPAGLPWPIGECGQPMVFLCRYRAHYRRTRMPMPLVAKSAIWYGLRPVRWSRRDNRGKGGPT